MSTAVLEPAPATGYAAPAVPMGDLFPYPDRPGLAGASAGLDDPQLIRIAFADGTTGTSHATWLRDACACTACRHPESLERTLDQSRVPLDVRPERLEVLAGGLEVTWSDGHLSHYGAGWLRACGRPEAVVPEPAPRLWDRGLEGDLPRFRFDPVMRDDRALLQWLRAFRETGLTYIEDAPLEEGTVLRLVERVGFVRATSFGALFDVRAVVGAVSNAYTAIDLPLHIDLVAREYIPGCQFLHCLVNEAEGGESVYGDGFAMAEDLRAEDPAGFDLLVRTRARFRYHDEATDYVTLKPLIELDDDGNVAQIRYNTAIMTDFEVPADAVPAVWRAYLALVGRTRNPAFQVQIKMRPGEIACFDNRRVLHGRRAFRPSTGRRHLQGAYLECEDLLSKLRVLERTQA